MSIQSIENTEQVRDLEKAVLGGLMLETERYDAVSLIIQFSDFEGQDHQSIFQSMGELVYANKPLDPLTVSGRLDNKNLLTRAGGKNYLIDLASSSPSAANLEAYAEMIRQKSISRKLMRINSEISQLIINPQGKDAAALLDEAETKIFSLNDEASKTASSIQKLDVLIPQSIDKLNQIANSGSSLLGSSTGFKDLDAKLQGLQNGDLIIVAARPSMGKTALSMNIVENFLLNKEVEGGVLAFSLEMPAESLTTRLLASNAKIDQQKVRSASMNQNDLKRFMESSSKLKDLPLYIDDSSMLSPMELRARARRIHRQEPNGLSLIVVDYLQLMELPSSTESRVNQISEISRSLKMLAKDLNVPVYATKFTMQVVMDMLKDENYDLEDLTLNTISQNSIIKFGNVRVTFFSTTHSIPESVGIAVHTLDGAIVYTSDFTFDQSGDVKYQTDFRKINEFTFLLSRY